MSDWKETILAAAKADAIPAGECGLWTVQKFTWEQIKFAVREEQKLVEIPPGAYTYLFRLTDATLHKPPGECVMHDTPDELVTHLDFMLRARGDVLVTGLGLGCVVRGLLANPQVRSVKVIERDPAVLQLVEPYMPKTERLAIVHAEAETWIDNNNEKFTCAWHDVWTDTAAGEEHLALKHNRLLIGMRQRVEMQGAWSFPRQFRRRLGHILKTI